MPRERDLDCVACNKQTTFRGRSELTGMSVHAAAGGGREAEVGAQRQRRERAGRASRYGGRSSSKDLDAKARKKRSRPWKLSAVRVLCKGRRKDRIACVKYGVPTTIRVEALKAYTWRNEVTAYWHNKVLVRKYYGVGALM